MSARALDPGVSQIVRRELNPGEKLVWFGCPEPGPFMWATTSWGMVPCAVPWTGFWLFLTWKACPGYRVDGSTCSLLFFILGVLCIAIGVAILGSPIWNCLNATQTVYAVTDGRLIVMDYLLRRTIKSYQRQDIDRVERRFSYRRQDFGRVERCDGNGDVGSIIFAAVTAKDIEGDTHTEENGFFGIANVRDVERVVREFKDQEG